MTLTPLEFAVEKRAVVTIPFNLKNPDGSIESYEFTAPKSAVMVMPVIEFDGDNDREIMKATFEWLGVGLPIAQRERLIGRLKDPEDDLDIPTLSSIIEGLVERIGELPPTQPDA